MTGKCVQNKIPDYYAVLDLYPTADEKAIKTRCRELAKKFHPDRNPGNEAESTERMQLLNAAKEVLLDSYKRAEHDACLRAARKTFDKGADYKPESNSNTQSKGSGNSGNFYSYAFDRNNHQRSQYSESKRKAESKTWKSPSSDFPRRFPPRFPQRFAGSYGGFYGPSSFPRSRVTPGQFFTNRTSKPMYFYSTRAAPDKNTATDPPVTPQSPQFRQQEMPREPRQPPFRTKLYDADGSDSGSSPDIPYKADESILQGRRFAKLRSRRQQG